MKKRRKKKNDGINAALTVCMIFALIFTISMIVIFCIYQETPDVLIGAVFTALFGELGFCTILYKSKTGVKSEGEADDCGIKLDNVDG